MAAKANSVELRIFRNGKAESVVSIPVSGRDEPSWKQEAMRWQYIVQQRHRWSASQSARRNLKQEATKTLAKFGVTIPKLQQLATTESTAIDGREPTLGRFIEVDIPWRSEALDWWARILPWEYLLSSATKPFQSGPRKVVVRRLRMRTRSAVIPLPESIALLESAPGVLRSRCDFQAERRLLRFALPQLNFFEMQPTLGSDPNLKSVAAWLREQQPQLLHIHGIDTHLGQKILNGPANSQSGIYVGIDQGLPKWIDAESFANTLFGQGYKPSLVAYNLGYSGARLAPLSLASGAHAAIGFDNTFDENVADLFFTQLYQRLDRSHWSWAQSIAESLDAISPYSDRLHGSGIVFWTRRSLLEVDSSKHVSLPSVAFVQSSVQGVEADPRHHRARDFVWVDAKPIDQVNYAHLHNGGSLMESLTIQLHPSLQRSQKTTGSDSSTIWIQSIRDIDIHVSLHAGKETFSYRARIGLDAGESIVQMASKALNATENHPAGGIFVPLTSELMRNIDESILTSLHVEVRWHDQVLYNRTFPVRLLPSDEWRFDDNQIVWMPSFVHPRDRAVTEIVDSAQRYLACLADDVSAGFGGYQAYNADHDEPWLGVDHQVQAIWMAIVLDHQLGYINPPPSYSVNAQRLRTPYRILMERRGTCVDLALLLAACLEWIEIYPVLFNLQTHAFVGYWRNLELYQRFLDEPRLVQQASTLETAVATIDNSNTPPPWYSPGSAYTEIRNLIVPPRGSESSRYRHRRIAIVPIEATLITARSGFQEAIDVGRAYFDQPFNPEFHSMIDIASSRSHVTPIPTSSLQPPAKNHAD